jgi:hypothetical protein
MQPVCSAPGQAVEVGPQHGCHLIGGGGWRKKSEILALSIDQEGEAAVIDAAIIPDPWPAFWRNKP